MSQGSRTMAPRVLAVVLALATVAVAGGCANDPAGGTTARSTAATTAATTAMAAPKGTAPFRAFGSIEQANVIGAQPDEPLVLVDRTGKEVTRGTADNGGSLVFYAVEPGAGYVVHGAGGSTSDAFSVLDRRQVPPDALHTDQPMQQGLNYVRMRDGITLAMTVRLPPGKALDNGPFPTVVEYSGYGTAAPHDLLASVASTIAGGEADPLAPDTATAVGAILAPLLGFATVSVQIRGSGCSGGAFDLFGLPTIYDGYDAIETVAAQPWVKGHKVGMVGISYSGYSQLFVGGTRPPHLAALAPMSVTDDLYDGIGFPGGIYNTGFGKGWLTERVNDAKAAPEGGQRWAKAEIAAGDQACLDNQKLHTQARDGVAILAKVEFEEPVLFADRTPGEWAAKIDVPTFLVGGLQDEQLGSHWAEVIPALRDNPDTWVTLYNGNHNDALQPALLTQWVEFLDLFVADVVPDIPSEIRGMAPVLFNEIAHAPAVPLAQSRLSTMRDAGAARDAFRKDPRIRILMDVGGGDMGPGALQPTWEVTAPSWPLPGTEATRFYLHDGGVMDGSTPRDDEVGATYVADPAARPETSVDDSPKAFPDQVNNWTPVADGKGLGWVSAPLDHDVFIAGTSSLDVQVTASAKDTDLQATLSEVRPDRRETYVETGWLRASHRKLDAARSTATDPKATHQSADAQELSPSEPALVRVSINPVAHLFRKGSRIRVTLQAPGGDRPLWKFRTVDDGTTKVTITSTAAKPSALVLPVAPITAKPAPLPPCDSLRGQPCRAYVAAANGG